jgi:hypothetical protein
MNENVDYIVKTPSKSTQFLWWCAGADEKILKYCSYSDHVKYLGIGGVVLATTFMAFLSMGFALHIIFEGNWFVTIPIAFIWSLIVFNLDRFIVSSTGKGDGESTISWSELANAAPRLLMAILLGLTISAPLEVFIFQKEIEREWNDTKNKMITARSYEIDRDNLMFEEDIKSKIDLKDKEVKRLEETVSKNKERVDKERVTGMGDQWEKSNLELDKEIKALDTLRKELKELESKTISLSTSKEEEKKREKERIDTLESGFLDKIMMLENLSAHDKKIPKFDPAKKEIAKEEEIIYGSAFWAVWMVRLLFMIIEIAPVILKLMLIKSPYDYMTENVNQILEAKQGISMNHMTDEEGKLTKYKENFNPKRIIAIVEHQNVKEEENAKEAITRFAEKEKKEIEKNPDAFINPNDSNT